MMLVGRGPAGPDSVFGHVTCTIRDLVNHPVPGSVVTLDFSECTDLAIASDQADPRLFTNCSARSVSAVTDVNGQAQFTVIGAGTTGPVHPPRSVHIYADGIFEGSIPVAVLDRDGKDGLTALDLSLWWADYLSGTDPERSDLDGSRFVDGLDLSVWAAAYFSGRNVYSAAAYCP